MAAGGTWHTCIQEKRKKKKGHKAEARAAQRLRGSVGDVWVQQALALPFKGRVRGVGAGVPAATQSPLRLSAGKDLSALVGDARCEHADAVRPGRAQRHDERCERGRMTRAKRCLSLAPRRSSVPQFGRVLDGRKQAGLLLWVESPAATLKTVAACSMGRWCVWRRVVRRLWNQSAGRRATKHCLPCKPPTKGILDDSVDSGRREKAVDGAEQFAAALRQGLHLAQPERRQLRGGGGREGGR